ncbi:glycosyltransferase [Blautia sp. HCP3S3_H10_1]|uniref:glycosyltransferase n=1 Tax=unclassified Blautia TaxID=2648079 RepID=UPI003F9186AA
MGKILHYIHGLPPVRVGGLVDYALDLAEVQTEQGHTVELLTPGAIWGRNRHHIWFRKKKFRNLDWYCIENPLPVPMACGIKDIKWYSSDAGFDEYKKFLEKIKPDVIHVHSLMGIHKSFFKAAKELHVRIVYTSHDYFGICPRTDLLRDGHICENKDWTKCASCCRNSFGTWHLIFDQSIFLRIFMSQNYALKILQKLMKMKANVLNKDKTEAEKSIDSSYNLEYEKLRKYYCDIWKMIDFFHFNSDVALEEYIKRIGDVPHAVVPICNRYCGDHRRLRKYGKKIRIGFFANNSVHKGFYNLLEVLNLLYKEGYDFCLNIYFPEPGDKPEYLEEHPPYKRDELEKIYEQNDLVVVPSMWKETYGLIVPEALSYGVPVVISENVGAKILLEHGTRPFGKIYGTENKQLYLTLKQILTDHGILSEWNTNICNAKLEFSMLKHVSEMMIKCYGGKYE